MNFYFGGRRELNVQTTSQKAKTNVKFNDKFQFSFRLGSYFSLELNHGDFSLHESHYKVHFPYSFNIFVFMTIFNLFNCRGIKKENGLLSGIKISSKTAQATLLMFIVHILVVILGGTTFRCATGVNFYSLILNFLQSLNYSVNSKINLLSRSFRLPHG